MAFEIASTNLVIELGVVLAVLIGWQFTLAELVGGPLMVAILVVLFRLFLTPRLVEAARRQAERHLKGVMEGHAGMDMSVTGGTLLRRLASPKGLTATSHYFLMDWASVWKDVAGGLLLAGALGAWVPREWWQALFLTRDPLLAAVWGPLLGPLVSVVSFVCSVGNVPLAAVLWNGGISFGGVTAFIFADLIVLPILNIYRKYYGGRVTIFLFLTFYAAMALAGLAVEIVFGALGLVPGTRAATISEPSITLDNTTVLDVLFFALAAMLVWRAARTGGFEMMRHMDEMPAAPAPS